MQCPGSRPGPRYSQDRSHTTSSLIGAPRRGRIPLLGRRVVAGRLGRWGCPATDVHQGRPHRAPRLASQLVVSTLGTLVTQELRTPQAGQRKSLHASGSATSTTPWPAPFAADFCRLRSQQRACSPEGYVNQQPPHPVKQQKHDRLRRGDCDHQVQLATAASPLAESLLRPSHCSTCAVPLGYSTSRPASL